MTFEEPVPVEGAGSSHEPGPAPSHRSSHQREEEPHHWPIWAETVLLIVIALVIAIIVKTFFFQAYLIPSESMEPLLQGGPGVSTNDRVIVEKLSYWGPGSPQRGDVIVFKDPGGWLTPEESATPGGIAKALTYIGLYPAGGHLVKRVIGLPGDVITCCDADGRIEVNGVAIDESAYARPSNTPCDQTKANTKAQCYGPMPGTSWTAGPVPKGYLFVMGDNRAHSADSSDHLCTTAQTDCSDSPWVPQDDVVGKVVGIMWPLSRFRTIHRPDDFATVPDVAPAGKAP